MTTKILIIRFSSIGDIVLTTPVIRCLKTQIENSVIHYLTKTVYSEIVTSNPHVEKVYAIKNDINENIAELKRENYDLVIDLHNNIRSALVKRKLGVKSYSVNKLNIAKWLMVNFKIDQLPDVHIVDRYLKTYPNGDRKNYAHYLKAMSYYNQIVDEKKDTFPILKAREYFEFIIKNYSP